MECWIDLRLGETYDSHSLNLSVFTSILLPVTTFLSFIFTGRHFDNYDRYAQYLL